VDNVDAATGVYVAAIRPAAGLKVTAPTAAAIVYATDNAVAAVSGFVNVESKQPIACNVFAVDVVIAAV
jgi:hypothetical protein